MKKNDANILI